MRLIRILEKLVKAEIVNLLTEKRYKYYFAPETKTSFSGLNPKQGKITAKLDPSTLDRVAMPDEKPDVPPMPRPKPVPGPRPKPRPTPAPTPAAGGIIASITPSTGNLHGRDLTATIDGARIKFKMSGNKMLIQGRKFKLHGRNSFGIPGRVFVEDMHIRGSKIFIKSDEGPMDFDDNQLRAFFKKVMSLNIGDNYKRPLGSKTFIVTRES